MATLIPADLHLPLRDIAPRNGRRGFQLAEMYELLSCQVAKKTATRYREDFYGLATDSSIGSPNDDEE